MNDEMVGLMDKMQDGKRVALAWEFFKPVMDAIKKEAEESLMQSVRSGKINELMVMKLEAIRSIEERVGRSIKRGHFAAEKLAEKGEI